MSDNRQKLIDKIRALKERTIENGCTEAEAMTAARLAQKLMDQSELTDDEILAGQTKATDRFHTRNDPVHGLARAVGRFTNTEIYRGTFRDRQTVTDLFGTEKVIRDESATRLRIIGLEHEVEIASYVLDICFNAMDAASGKALQAENDERARAGEPLLYGGERKNWVGDFQRGMASRMSESLLEMAEQARPAAKLESSGNALVLVRNDLIRQWFADNGIRTSTARSPRSGVSGFNAGRMAGANVSFHSGVASGQRAVHAIGGR
jgi:Protein of unknown function (DUF2786)